MSSSVRVIHCWLHQSTWNFSSLLGSYSQPYCLIPVKLSHKKCMCQRFPWMNQAGGAIPSWIRVFISTVLLSRDIKSALLWHTFCLFLTGLAAAMRPAMMGWIWSGPDLGTDVPACVCSDECTSLHTEDQISDLYLKYYLDRIRLLVNICRNCDQFALD